MEFLLINHPLDCPICDQAGECKLQDYSYSYGSGDSRMAEVKRRYRYEDLGAKIVIDKNRCIHCTRCVRFTREITGGGELIVASRGSHLEVTTYTGKSLDQNPFAGNVVDLCPVGALTSREFRFRKRVWYLKSVPSISRHSALGNPIWVDHEGNQIHRFRPRPLEGKETTHFISDEERQSYTRYNLGELATSADLRYGSGDKTIAVVLPKYQTSADGILNRRGFTERGFRFGALEDLLAKVQKGEVKAVVLLHDEAFTSLKEAELLGQILKAAPFSLALEAEASALGQTATAWLPITTFAEESDFIVNHDGELRRYQKAIQPPKGVRTVPAWVKDLAAVPVPA
jgi:NADH dehydrogenase/NADH:ubiquinone oxidoreductase subunit G